MRDDVNSAGGVCGIGLNDGPGAGTPSRVEIVVKGLKETFRVPRPFGRVAEVEEADW